MTAKQVANRRYYREHKDKIAEQKRQYRADHREEINNKHREYQRRRRTHKMRCFICGGDILTDGEVYSCMNPECEADFIEAN